ncbi:MAG: aminopeptidase [Bacteroidetes bacterium]|nr:aminopeptidase [Bacteroidota bacterium]
MKKKILVVFILTFSLVTISFSQDTIRNKKGGGYLFTKVVNYDATPVQDQSNTGTCWSFSALSFFESELLRKGKGNFNLSEMFVVRNAYIDKAQKYVRMHGKSNFGQGGSFWDIPYIIKNYGIVPEEVYSGKNYGGGEKHNHAELEAILGAIVKVISENPQKTLTTSWKKAYTSVVDAYLGNVPDNFTFQGKKYTPISFAANMGLNMDDYITITSFTHHPFYQKFILEVEDNWASQSVYNVPADEMMSIVNNALKTGYTIAWATDVSEKGFSFKNGLAIVPEDETNVSKKGEDNKHFNNAGADKTGTPFDAPCTEKSITQQDRQDAFDNFQTTDDHGMHITGIYKDQTGKVFYRVKNSWGVKHNDCDGYLFASETYVKYKTMDIMVHKDALPSDIKKKLGIN